MAKRSTTRNGAKASRDRLGKVLEDWKHERPDLSAPIQRIRARLVLLGATINRDNHVIARKFGISGPEMRILYALRRIGAPYRLRPTDLQEALLVPSPTVSRQLDRLVQLGLVERVPDGQDRRGYWAQLTRPGVAAADAALTESVAHSAVSAALNRLQPDDQQRLDRILQELLMSL